MTGFLHPHWLLAAVRHKFGSTQNDMSGDAEMTRKDALTLAEIDARARAMRAAYMRDAMQRLVARLRAAPQPEARPLEA